MEVKEQFFQRYVKTRWLALIPVVKRLLEQYNILAKYFSDFPDKDKASCRGKFMRIVEKLKSNDLKIQMMSILNVGPLLEGFLTLFQSKGLLVHILYIKMLDLVHQLMLRFVRHDLIQGKSADS
jgi:hypothetical protein